MNPTHLFAVEIVHVAVLELYAVHTPSVRVRPVSHIQQLGLGLGLGLLKMVRVRVIER